MYKLDKEEMMAGLGGGNGLENGPINGGGRWPGIGGENMMLKGNIKMEMAEVGS